MPNQHKPDSVCISTWVPRTLKTRLEKAGKLQNFSSLSAFVSYLYYNASAKVHLTAEDYQKIAKETHAAEQRILAGGRSRKTKDAG